MEGSGFRLVLPSKSRLLCPQGVVGKGSPRQAACSVSTYGGIYGVWRSLVARLTGGQEVRRFKSCHPDSVAISDRSSAGRIFSRAKLAEGIWV